MPQRYAAHKPGVKTRFILCIVEQSSSVLPFHVHPSPNSTPSPCPEALMSDEYRINWFAFFGIKLFMVLNQSGGLWSENSQPCRHKDKPLF